MHYKIKKTVLSVLLAFSMTASFAQQGPAARDTLALTLAQVWQKADAFSKSVQMQQVLVKKSEQQVQDAHAERLPEVQIAGNIEKATNIPMYENGLFHEPTQHEVIHTLYRIGADAYLNVYNGGKTNLKILEEEIHHKVAIEKQNLTISETRLLAAAYYLNLQKCLIFKQLTLMHIADQEKQLQEIKQFLKHGLVLKSDVLRAELKLSDQRLALVKIGNDILLVSQKLNIVIGEPDERPINPKEKLDPELLPLASYETVLQQAMEKSYHYRISEQESHLRQVQLKQVKANVAPSIALTGDFYYANPQIFLYPYSPSLYSLGIGAIRASFPISSFYHNKHKQKAAELELHKQEIEHAHTGDKVRQQVKEAYLRFKEARVRIDVARVNLAQAEENYRIVRNTYFKQTSLITDLLDADVQLLQTRFELAASRIAAQLQYYQLQNIIGNL
jgi:outer membrane protein